MKRLFVRILLCISTILLLFFIGVFVQSQFDGEFEQMYGDSVDELEYYEGQGYAIGKNIMPPLLIMAFGGITMWLQSINHRLGKKKKSTLRKEDINSPFILYLRSFVDDANTQKRTGTISDITSEEEALVDALSDIAPVYAIGNPKDKMSPLGASRLYVSDDEWKNTVEYLAQRAQVVVLRLGSTDSFWWEVKMALSKIDKKRILFVIPESDSLDSMMVLSKYLYDQNVDMSNVKTSVAKRQFGSISSFIYFNDKDEACSAKFVAYRFTSLVLSYANMLRSSLADFRKRFGLVTNAPKVRKLRCLQVGVYVYFLFIGGANMFYDCVTLNIASKNTIETLCADIDSFNESLPKEIGLGIIWKSMELYGKELYMVYSYPSDCFEIYSQEYFDNDEVASSLVKYIPDWLTKKYQKFDITLVYRIQNEDNPSQEYVVHVTPSRLTKLKEYAESHSSVLDVLRSQFNQMTFPIEIEEGVYCTSANIEANDVIYTYTIDNDLYYDGEALSEIKKEVIEEFASQKSIVESIKKEGVRFIYIYQYADGEVNARFEILPDEF